jgi:hypothetical protein
MTETRETEWSNGPGHSETVTVNCETGKAILENFDPELDEYMDLTRQDVNLETDPDLDREAAERLIKRYAKLETEAAAAVLYIDTEIAEARKALDALLERREEILKPVLRKRNFLDSFLPALSAWAEQALGTGRARSIKLAYGTVGFRKQPDRLDVLDAAAAVAWCEANLPTAITKSVAKTELKSYAKETGETPAGCEFVMGTDKFSVSTANIGGGN